MMRALVRDGRVAELIPETVEVDGIEVPISERFAPDLVAQMIEAPDGVEVGWTYDGESFAPQGDQPPSDLPKRRFSFLEFMDLFTEAEQLTLVEASMTFPAIKLWYDRAVGAQYIDLDDPRTETGLQKLVDENLIVAERKAAVMTGQRPT